MRTGKSIPLLAAIAVLAGCATSANEKYDWGDYDPSLYSYYKSPAKVGELTAALEETIKAAGSHSQPVPPGLYAEYGYLMLQQGKAAEALSAFRAEEKQWPEAKVFMDHMIQVTEHSGSQAKGS